MALTAAAAGDDGCKQHPPGHHNRPCNPPGKLTVDKCVLTITTAADSVVIFRSCRTLIAFGVVTLSVAVRARYVSGKGIAKWRVMLPCALVVIGSCMIGFPYYYQAHWAIILAGGVAWAAGTAGFYMLPRVHRPEGFAVPLNPILPCLGTLANIFLIGERGCRGTSSVQFAVQKAHLLSKARVDSAAQALLRTVWISQCCILGLMTDQSGVGGSCRVTPSLPDHSIPSTQS